jgi:hypothetical protein
MSYPNRAVEAFQESTPYQFSSVGHALGWSTEVLRRQRHASTSRWHREVLSETDSLPFASEIPDPMPQMDYQARLSLAMTLQNLIYSHLDETASQLILRRYWGDYHHPQVLAQARQVQEQAQRQGKRVRLRYRYPLRTLAAQDEVSERTIRRRLEQAQAQLARVMVVKGLLPNAD